MRNVVGRPKNVSDSVAETVASCKENITREGKRKKGRVGCEEEHLPDIG